MKQGYKPVLALKLFHEYYKNGSTQDFQCAPTAECQRILDGHQLIFKKQPDGFELLGRYDDINKQPYISMEKNTRLLFTLQLSNPNLLNYTALARENGTVLFFSNKKGKNSLAQRSVKLRPKLFKHSFQLKHVNQVELQIASSSNTEIYRKTINGKDGMFDVTIDLSGYNSGMYLFKLVHSGKTLLSEWMLINDRLYADQPFGLIALQKHTTNWSNDPFFIRFATKSVPWKYHVIKKKEYADCIFKIEQADQKNENNRYANFPFHFGIASSQENENTIVFESSQIKQKKQQVALSIPFYEESTLLQLVQYRKKNYKKDDDDDDDDDKRYKYKKYHHSHYHWHHHDHKDKGKIILKKLPKPSINNLKPDVFIYI